jgi:hypothetical protein
MGQVRRSAAAAALLVLAGCATAPPAPPTPVHHVSSIAGTWEGIAPVARGAKPGPATLVISPEGSYELTYSTGSGAPGHARGRLRVQDGRVTYRSTGGGTGTITLHQLHGAPILHLTSDRGWSSEFHPARPH